MPHENSQPTKADVFSVTEPMNVGAPYPITGDKDGDDVGRLLFAGLDGARVLFARAIREGQQIRQLALWFDEHENVVKLVRRDDWNKIALERGREDWVLVPSEPDQLACAFTFADRTWANTEYPLEMFETRTCIRCARRMKDAGVN